MPCYHPALIKREFIKSTGEMVSRFMGSCEKYKDHPFYGEYVRSLYNGTKQSAFLLEEDTSWSRVINLVQIPCGRCIGCRIDYSRSWSDRMVYHSLSLAEREKLKKSSDDVDESKKPKNWFITLTYNDEALEKLDRSPDFGIASLCYDDVTKFVKALRNKFRGANIDYYYSGEYGDANFRCHFHFIGYGFPIDDLEFWKLNDLGDPIYVSKTIEKLWQWGFCTVEEFTWHTAAYAAGYVIKKRDGRKMCEYEAAGIEPEKCRMSRRPGIAYQYYQDHWRELWENDGLAVPRSVTSSGKLGIPRYFRKLATKAKGTAEHVELMRQSDLRGLERTNVVTPIRVYNSSFDMERVHEMLKFQEREVLQRNRKRA